MSKIFKKLNKLQNDVYSSIILFLDYISNDLISWSGINVLSLWIYVT
jgi:hypothetical protein